MSEEAAVPEWAASLPESVQGWDEVKQSDSAEHFYDQVGEMRSRMGRSITIPGEDANEDIQNEFVAKLKDKVPSLVSVPDDDGDWSGFYQNIGKPLEVDGYAIPEIEGVTLDDDRVAFLRQTASDANMTKKQFGDFLGKVLGAEAEQVAAQRTQLSEDTAAQKAEWAGAYDERVGIANKVLQRIMPGSDISTVPADQIKGMYELGKSLGESSIEPLDQSGPSGMTALDVDTAVSDIRNNPEKWDLYMDKNNRSGDALRAKMAHLYEQKAKYAKD